MVLQTTLRQVRQSECPQHLPALFRCTTYFVGTAATRYFPLNDNRCCARCCCSKHQCSCEEGYGAGEQETKDGDDAKPITLSGIGIATNTRKPFRLTKNMWRTIAILMTIHHRRGAIYLWLIGTSTVSRVPVRLKWSRHSKDLLS